MAAPVQSPSLVHYHNSPNACCLNPPRPRFAFRAIAKPPWQH